MSIQIMKALLASGCTFHVFSEVLQELERKNRQQYLGVYWTVDIDISYVPITFCYNFLMNTELWFKRTKKTVLLITGRKWSGNRNDLAEIEYY